jgi:hypothetical protein
VVGDERRIGGSDEYFSGSDAHLGRINVLYHQSLGGKCDAGNLVNHTRGQNWVKGHYKRVKHQFF